MLFDFSLQTKYMPAKPASNTTNHTGTFQNINAQKAGKAKAKSIEV